MNQPTSIARIGGLLAITIGITVLNSYIPHDLTLARQMLSFVQLGFMCAIMIIALRAVLRDF